MKTHNAIRDRGNAKATMPETIAPNTEDDHEAPLHPIARAIASQPISQPISRPILSSTVQAIDAVLIATTGLIVCAIYVIPKLGIFQPVYIAAVAVAALVAVTMFRVFGLYEVSALRHFLGRLGHMVAGWAIAFACLAVIAFLSKLGAEFSRAWFLIWFVAGFASLIAFRMILAGKIKRWTAEGRLARRTVIVGGGPEGEKLIAALEQAADADLNVCGIFDDRADDRSPAIVGGLPKLGSVDDLVRFARKTRLDLLIVSIPMTAERRVLEMMRKLWVLPVDIRLSAHTNKLRFRPRSYSFLGGVPMLDIVDKPLADWDFVIKLTFDRIVAALAVVAALPVMAVVAIAIRLESKGPVLFKQKRYGFNNELIEVLKFRSMYVDRCDATASKLVTKDDPRVTRVGRFIRKTSLDELPQLSNALRGELSLVGPRPHAVHAKAANQLYNEVVDGYFARHRVKPGITGWAQINGWRGETDTQEKIEKRVEHDLYYIENWSIWFDIYIMAMTPVALLCKRDNAY